MDTIIWIIFWLLIVVGIAGVILPALPGFVLILAALIIHKIFMPDYFSNLLLGVAVLVFLLVMAVDFLSVLLAARLSGSGKWGMGGAGVGMAIGFFHGFMGAIVGSLLGAFIGEKIFAKKQWWPSLKAGLGSAAGFIAALGIKIILTTLVVIWIAVACVRNSFF
ncbi:DUF456 domain-containing protein [Kamptonema cortianum]|nr:DUF456 domain-containing protein [Oscillatoria laete-virens]MDK3159585.1 DUF456 domain-containing protein [Kamptonema cortianum]MDL5053277.1 DUF456 domain-containing protein [Oscillatoria laete-virens NRMC-F 0139]